MGIVVSAAVAITNNALTDKELQDAVRDRLAGPRCRAAASDIIGPGQADRAAMSCSGL